MTTVSRFTPEQRTAYADQVIDDVLKLKDLAGELEIPRQTIQNWVNARKKERGIPAQPPGTGNLSPLQLKNQIVKLKERNVVLATTVRELTERIERAEAEASRHRQSVEHLKGTLRLYMESGEAG